MKTRTFLPAMLLLLAPLSGSPSATAGSIPISVTGFNQDVIVEASAINDPTTHYANAVTASMDSGTLKTAYTWYEAGLPGGGAGGLPASGTIVSAADPSVSFQLARYNELNALLLDSGTTSGALAFAAPASYSALSFLVSSSLGSPTSPVLSLKVNFADGTPALTGLSVVAPDWFNNGPVAYTANGRVSVDQGTFDQVDSGNPRIYQENVVLPASALGHSISSIDFTWSASGSPTAHTAIFAVSGVVPEPASLLLLASGMLGLVIVARRQNATNR